MIVVPAPGDRLEIINQIDHARFAADLLTLWISDGLPEHPRRKDLLLAVREHDNGWHEKDSAPMLDLSMGDRPYDFMTTPAETRSDLWKVSCQRFREGNAYVALLIVEHAIRLHAHRTETVYRELQEWLADLRSELIIAAEMDEDRLQADYAFLELTDLISLVACSHWTQPHETQGVTIEQCDGRLKLDPFPLAGTTTFKIPKRAIPRRVYRDAVDLAGELASARWQWREVGVGT